MHDRFAAFTIKQFPGKCTAMPQAPITQVLGVFLNPITKVTLGKLCVDKAFFNPYNICMV